MEVALEVDEPTRATVVAATVIRDDQGAPTGAPLLARLPDGRHMALAPADDEVTGAVGQTDVPGLVGSPIVVEPGGRATVCPQAEAPPGDRPWPN